MTSACRTGQERRTRICPQNSGMLKIANSAKDDEAGDADELKRAAAFGCHRFTTESWRQRNAKVEHPATRITLTRFRSIRHLRLECSGVRQLSLSSPECGEQTQ